MIFQRYYLQVALGLILWSASKAGYYTSTDYLMEGVAGYSTRNSNLSSAWAFIGTLGSVGAVSLVPFALRHRLSAPILILLGANLYAIASAVWSPVFDATAVVVAKDVAYVLAAITICNNLSAQQVCNVASILSIVVLTISLVLAITDVTFAISFGSDGWRGLFIHKNGLAAFCGAMPLLIVPVVTRSGFGLLTTIAAALIALMLIMSRGKTMVLLVILYLILIAGERAGVFYSLTRNRRTFRTVSIGVGILYVALSLLALSLAYGGALSFSGRSILWTYFLDRASTDWVWGLGGYSLKLDPLIAAEAVRSVGLPSPDSSVVLVLFNFGIVGAIFYFVFVLACAREGSLSVGHGSLSVLLATGVYVGYGAMESDAHFGSGLLTLTLVAVVVLARKSQLLSAPEHPVGARFRVAARSPALTALRKSTDRAAPDNPRGRSLLARRP